MHKGYQLLLVFISFIGISFGRDLVVKILKTDATESEEEIIHVQKQKKNSRNVASALGPVPVVASPTQVATAEHENFSSTPPHDEHFDQEIPFSHIAEPQWVEEAENYMYHSSARAPALPTLPVMPNTRASSSQIHSSFFSIGSPSVVNTKESITSIIPMSSPIVYQNIIPPTPITETPDAEIPPAEVLSYKLFFDSNNFSKYTFNTTQMILSQNSLSLSRPGFQGQLVGLEKTTDGEGKQTLTLGTEASCNGQLQNCAEFDSSWTPKWNDVLAVWHFNETSLASITGGFDFADSSGNNNHGKRLRTGYIGGAGRMKSSLQNLNTNPLGAELPVNLSVTNKMSLSFWFNNRSPVATSSATLVLEYTPNINSNQGAFYFASSDCSSTRIACGNTSLVAGSTFFAHQAPPISQGWQHVVLTVDRSKPINEMKIYINGKKINSTIVNGLSNSIIQNFANSKLYLFGRAGTTFDTKGDIDELALWKNILDDEDVSTIYERQSASFGDAKTLGIYKSPVIDANKTFSWSGLGWKSLFANSKRPLSNDNPESYVIGSHQIRDNLVAYWKFDEATNSSGINSIKDYSGNGYHATPSSGYTPGESGKLNLGAKFNATVNAYAVVNDSNGLRMDLEDFSISAWFKTRPTLEHQYIISRSVYGATNGRWTLSLNPAGQIATLIDFPSIEFTLTTPNSYADGKWHHVVLRMKRNSLVEIYVDGKWASSRNVAPYVNEPLNANTKVLISGYMNTAGTAPHATYNGGFNGMIDELGVWKRALDPEEIQDLYLRGSTAIKHQIRACNQSDCSDQKWQGPDGTSETFFSELLNEGPQTPQIPFASPFNTRHFQYRTIFENSAPIDLGTPTLIQVSIPGWQGDYYVSSEFVTEAIEVKAYTQLVELLGPNGCQENITYFFSSALNGPWYFWNGTNWELAQANSSGNLASDFTEQAFKQYYLDFGGQFYLKGKLHSDGNSMCELSSLEFKN